MGSKRFCSKCKSSILFWLFRCKRYSKDRKICLESGRFARSSCPNALLVNLRISDLPTGYCNIKHPKGSPGEVVWSPIPGTTYRNPQPGGETISGYPKKEKQDGDKS